MIATPFGSASQRSRVAEVSSLWWEPQTLDLAFEAVDYCIVSYIIVWYIIV